MTRTQEQALRRLIKNRGYALQPAPGTPGRFESPSTVLLYCKELVARRDSPMSDVTDEALIQEARARGLVD